MGGLSGGWRGWTVSIYGTWQSGAGRRRRLRCGNISVCQWTPGCAVPWTQHSDSTGIPLLLFNRCWGGGGGGGGIFLKFLVLCVWVWVWVCMVCIVCTRVVRTCVLSPTAVCMDLYLHSCVHGPVPTQLCTWTSTYTAVCMDLYIHGSVHGPVPTQLCAWTCTYTALYIGPLPTQLCTSTSTYTAVCMDLYLHGCVHGPVPTQLCAWTCTYTALCMDLYLHSSVRGPLPTQLCVRCAISSGSMQDAIDTHGRSLTAGSVFSLPPPDPPPRPPTQTPHPDPPPVNKHGALRPQPPQGLLGTGDLPPTD